MGQAYLKNGYTEEGTLGIHQVGIPIALDSGEDGVKIPDIVIIGDQ